ncbi:hypothetical protein CVT30_05420 [Streptomyces sp. AMCC400023]|nr:hypothetical protein CVT30_05420 [Streptomyces sp. AMCC400023]
MREAARGDAFETPRGRHTKGQGRSPLPKGTARTPRSHATHTGAPDTAGCVTRCLRTSDEQRPSPIDGNRTV